MFTRIRKELKLSDAFLLAYLCTQHVCMTNQVTNLWICRALFVLYVCISVIYDVIPAEKAKQKRLSSVMVWCFSFVGILVTSSLWSADLTLSLSRTTINAIIHILALSLLLHYRITDGDSLFVIILVYIAFAVYMSICLAIRTPSSEWGTVRAGASIGANPNTIAVLVSCAVYLTVFASRYYKMKVLLALVIPLTYVCFMTGSRKGVVFLFLVMAALPFLEKDAIKSFFALLIALLILCILYRIIMLNPTVYQLLGRRLTALTSISGLADESLNERSWFRQYAFEHANEALLFGHGPNSFAIRMGDIGYSHVTYSHCNYTELLFCYGLVGFAAYYSIFLSKLLCSVRCYSQDKLLSVMVCFLILGQLILDYGMVSYLDISSMFLNMLAFYGMDVVHGGLSRIQVP